MRLMNDDRYNQILNPNQSFKLVLIVKESTNNSFYDIFTTLAKDFITSHSLSQFLQVQGVDDLIVTTQSPPRIYYHI